MKKFFIWSFHLILAVVTSGIWLIVIACYYWIKKPGSEESSVKFGRTSPNKLYKDVTGRDL